MADPGDTAAADALPQGWVVIGTRDWRSVWGVGAKRLYQR